MWSNNEIIKMALESTLRKVEEAGRTMSEMELSEDKEEKRVCSAAREKLVAAHRLIRNLCKVYESKCLKQSFFSFDATN
jgi:predicted ATPase